MNERKINITANVPRPQVQKNSSGLEISMESTANSKKNGIISVIKSFNKPPVVPNKQNDGIKFLEQKGDEIQQVQFFDEVNQSFSSSKVDEPVAINYGYTAVCSIDG